VDIYIYTISVHIILTARVQKLLFLSSQSAFNIVITFNDTDCPKDTNSDAMDDGLNDFPSLQRLKICHFSISTLFHLMTLNN